MSRLWRTRRRLRLGSGDLPDRLGIDGDAALEVILCGQLVRYALLPWSPALSSEAEWMAYARHSFGAIHGAAAEAWTICISPSGRRQARIASAIDTELFDALRADRRVVSIRPLLMDEYNARRAELGDGPAWLVVRETDRLTLGLVAGGEWRIVRTRQAHSDWRAALPDLLAREIAASGEPSCERLVLCEATA